MAAPADSTAPDRSPLTPSALTRLVRDLLEDALPLLWIEGELSNLARPASGHLYFTLKDAHAQVRCAMFRPRAQLLRFRPADGQHVLLRARVTLYEPRGEFQLVVEHMQDAGAGALQRAYEELRAKLAAEGLFDAARKRPLPALPRRIGVITSASGAAVRDVLSVLARRFPLVEAELLPVPVQGREAPPAIAAMLTRAAASGRYDVLLLTRGGGAAEDLWAFNDEGVVRAIAASAVPVVAAIGHETDFTLAEFAADLRAPTPSAAAELLVPDAQELTVRLAALRQRAARALRRRLDAQAQGLDQRWARLQTQRPQARLALLQTRLAALTVRLCGTPAARLAAARARLGILAAQLQAHDPRRALAETRRRLAAAMTRLAASLHTLLPRRQQALAAMARALHTVSPLATLERGYAILLDAEGRVLRRATDARAGDHLQARLADGSLRLRVVANER